MWSLTLGSGSGLTDDAFNGYLVGSVRPDSGHATPGLWVSVDGGSASDPGTGPAAASFVGWTYALAARSRVPADAAGRYVWQETVQLVLDSNGGAGVPWPVSGGNGELLTVPNNPFTHAGHDFTGWNTAADGSGTGFAAGDTTKFVAPGVRLYAQWQAPVTEVAPVSVGDWVWHDKNHNGRQDSGEPGIGGVVLKLVGPGGKPVTGVFGHHVGPVTTVHGGWYVFDNLPLLGHGQSYTVVIDKNASADALQGMKPTREHVGDRYGDSSSWQASSQGSTGAGQTDMSLDFGFVVASRPGLPTTGAPGQDTTALAGWLMLGLISLRQTPGEQAGQLPAGFRSSVWSSRPSHGGSPTAGRCSVPQTMDADSTPVALASASGS